MIEILKKLAFKYVSIIAPVLKIVAGERACARLHCWAFIYGLRCVIPEFPVRKFEAALIAYGHTPEIAQRLVAMAHGPFPTDAEFSALFDAINAARRPAA